MNQLKFCPICNETKECNFDKNGNPFCPDISKHDALDMTDETGSKK